MAAQDFPIGQRITLPGHFGEPVLLEAVRAIGTGYEFRVRLRDGTPDEAILSNEEAAALLGEERDTGTGVKPADAESVRLVIESARIRLAYTHDRHFAVSLSGIRTLPHQIEAVYVKMLPQPRLRFLLADDPGAGKTIMAGLLIKELKLREAIDRILILCPAPLTIQWQDEMLRWFGEPFEEIFAAVDQQQLVNPWQRWPQVVASMDYAKQDEVRERVWQQQWDLVIIDEAHKCSAYTKRSAGRGDEAEKTVDLFKLGSPPATPGIGTAAVVDGLYSYLGFTRAVSAGIVAKAIATGVQQANFGYVSGAVPALGADGKYQVAVEKVAIGAAVSEEEIDLESGFLMVPGAIPARAPEPTPPGGPEAPPPGGGPSPVPPGTPTPVPPGTPAPAPETVVAFGFAANRTQLYSAWNALANLADMAGIVSVNVHAEAPAGFDKTKLENGVMEPLREAGLLE